MLFYGQVISKESETLNVVEAVEFDVTPIGMNAKVIATHHIHNTTDKSMECIRNLQNPQPANTFI